VVASSVTVTVTLSPGCNVAVVGDVDSHGTSVTLEHWSKPGSNSLSCVGVKPPVDPPIFTNPHAAPDR
jgi:hypothetical protein